MIKFGFSIDKLSRLIDLNKRNCGDKAGDNGKEYDALIVYFYLMQKYSDKEISTIAKNLTAMADTGTEFVLDKILDLERNLTRTTDD